MQFAGDGSCNCGCDILMPDDFAVRVMSVQMGGMRMGGEECCAKTPSVSPSQPFEREEDEGTDFGWLCMEG